MTTLAGYAGIVLSVIGMMLVIAGVIASGLFLPGVVTIVAGMLAFIVAGLAPLFVRANRE